MDWWWVILIALRGVSPSQDDQWAVRLAELDRTRAVAFEHADPSRLDGVYAEGSRGRRADAETIAAYARRGGRVVGAELTILRCRVMRSSDDRVDLEVVDQLGAARVVWNDGTTTELPRDRPTRRVVTVQRGPQGWRIAASRQATEPARKPSESAGP
jgi:hypothetical protein